MIEMPPASRSTKLYTLDRARIGAFRNPAVVDTLTTRQVEVGGRTIELVVPAAPDALLEAAAAGGAATPYWIDLWPCAERLAAWTAAQPLAGRRVLELGCGLGLPSLVAALGGAQVLATDVEPAALECVAASAARLGVAVETAPADYRDPPAGCFDLVLAADVLYEPDCAAALAALAPCSLAAGGALVVAVSWEGQEAELARLLREAGFAVEVDGPRPWLLHARRAL
jgi:predicted nicotinamide N-methyase